jgi:hypothetical protein
METEFEKEFLELCHQYRKYSNSHYKEITNFEYIARLLLRENLELKAKVKMLEHQLVTFSDNLTKPKRNESSVP